MQVPHSRQLLLFCPSCPQLEDTADHFSTTLKAGGIMDVVEKVGRCSYLQAERAGSSASRSAPAPAPALPLLVPWIHVVRFARSAFLPSKPSPLPSPRCPLQYPWSGATVEHPRRDKRKGIHRAHVARSEAGDPCIM